MTHFDKTMALDVIEDALANTRTPHARGVAAGLCGAFYMSGLLSREEWEAFLARIPAGSVDGRGARTPDNSQSGASGRLLN